MAEKGFGVKEVNLIGASGTPTITSPNNLNLNAVNVAISTNVSIGGTLTVSGNISIGGTLTYEDVTNIDSVGVVTARNGLNVSGGNVTIAKDIDVDGHTNLDNVNVSGVTTFVSNLTISGDASNNSMITESGSGNLFIKADDTYFNNAAGNTFLGRFSSAGLTTPNILLNGNVTHNGDTNTYFGFPGNDQFTVTTAGYARMEFVGDYIYINSQQTGNNRALMYNSAAGLGFYGSVSSSASDQRSFSFYTNGNTQKLEINPSGVKVTGICTATSFSGSGANLTSLPAANLTGTLPAISGANLTGIAVTEAPVVDYTVTANGSSAYRFHGGGVDETADDPTLYLIRGQKYRFNNTTGSSHPFALRVSSGGSAYTDGVTGSQNGIQFFTVPYAAPSSLVYQCTVHSGMVGSIVIRGGSSTAAISNNADNRVITGGTDGNLNGESGLTFSSDRLILTNTSTPQIRINNDTSDGSSTRFVIGKATGSNNFFNGAVAGDSCIGFPGDLLFGVGTAIKVRISSEGYVTKPLTPAFNVKGTNMSRTDTSGYICTFDNTTSTGCFDTGGNFNTSTYKFKAPITGLYYFFTNIRLDSFSTGYIRTAFLSTNYGSGSTYWGIPETGHVIDYYHHVTNILHISSSTLMNLDKDDEVYVWQDPSADTSYTCYLAESSFGGYLVG